MIRRSELKETRTNSVSFVPYETREQKKERNGQREAKKEKAESMEVSLQGRVEVKS